MGAKLTVGVNDLASQCPELVAEWDYEKNGDVTPEMVAQYSSKKVWWTCQICGNSWSTAVSCRTGGGAGCPKCGRNRIALGRRRPKAGHSLSDEYPSLAEEWHPTKNGDERPEDYKAGSNKKVWWLGKCGHEWEAVIDSRAHNGRGCPFCAGRLLTGFNDLETRNPTLSSEWHPTKNGDLTPSGIVATSRQKVWWLGKCGHEWEASVKSRHISHSGCPECRKSKRVSFKEKAVLYYLSQAFVDAEENAHPKVAGLGKAEFDIWIPSISSAVEVDGYYYHNKNPKRDARKDAACKKSDIRLIRIREDGCLPYDGCSAELIPLEDNNSNQAIDNAIVELLHLLGCDDSIDVDTKRDGSQILELVQLTHVNDSISVTNPEAAAEWHPVKNGALKPEMFTRGSNYNAWWVCSTCGHEWQTKVTTRGVGGCGCPMCRAAKISETKQNKKPNGGRSLGEKFPEYVEMWDEERNGSISPFDVSYGSKRTFWFICPEGHSFQAKPNSLTGRRGQTSGCPVCANRVRSKKLSTPKEGKSLAELHPELVAEWSERNGDLRPADVTAHTSRKAWWVCSSCGYVWEARICNRSRGSGCPSCYEVGRRKNNKGQMQLDFSGTRLAALS